jgi:hypothetical protein
MHAIASRTSAHAQPRVRDRVRRRSRATGCKSASRKKSSFSRSCAHARCLRASTTTREFALFLLASVSGIPVGTFAIYGASLAIGRGRPGNSASENGLNAMGRPRPDNGVSWSDVVLGNARTAPGSNLGTVRGIDFSASFTAGSSIVTSINYTDCTCQK